VAEIDDKRDADGEDAAVEATVLRQLLLIHPGQVTIEELIVDVAADPDAFAERDAIERAVRELARAGLVHRNGEFAIPSRAALRFDELLGG
jgi:predicted transcriptional regulator